MAGRCIVVYEQDDKKEKVLKRAVDRIKQDAEGRNPQLILFFSDNLKFYYYSSMLHEEFKDTTVVGAVTDTNICSDGLGEKGLSVLVIFEGIEVETGLILDITSYPMKYSKAVKKSLEEISDYENTICVEFTTSLVKAEELILDTLEEGLKESNIPIFGSSTGIFEDSIMTYVSLNGEVYSEGTVYLLIHNCNGKIGLFKENIYRPTSFTFTATDVDCEERALYEIDNNPAVMFLSDRLSMKKSEIVHHLKRHPIGRVIDDEIYITSVNEADANGTLECNSRIYNRTKLVLTELEDIKAVWNRSKEQLSLQFPEKSFCIMVNCHARTELFKEEGLLLEFKDYMTNEYGPFIGISGMGEQINFKHLNQTMILAIFE